MAEAGSYSRNLQCSIEHIGGRGCDTLRESYTFTDDGNQGMFEKRHESAYRAAQGAARAQFAAQGAARAQFEAHPQARTRLTGCERDRDLQRRSSKRPPPASAAYASQARRCSADSRFEPEIDQTKESVSEAAWCCGCDTHSLFGIRDEHGVEQTQPTETKQQQRHPFRCLEPAKTDRITQTELPETQQAAVSVCSPGVPRVCMRKRSTS